jgi:hypothetical protein
MKVDEATGSAVLIASPLLLRPKQPWQSTVWQKREPKLSVGWRPPCFDNAVAAS